MNAPTPAVAFPQREHHGSALRAPRVIILGAGMSGLLAGIRLRQAGIEDFTIYEKSQEVGGTWRENRYPGLACDVPAHYYTYSFEPNPDWQHRFARGPEIQNYMRHVADKYDLRRHIVFGEEGAQARFDGRRWQLQLRSGRQDSAEFLIAACGFLHHPREPDIPGLDRFAGARFHSARWDDSVDLKDKRIGLIGTGSTGVQIVCAVSRLPCELNVFQRTPQWVFPLPDREYSLVERELVTQFPGLARLAYQMYDELFDALFSRAMIRPGLQRRLIEAACHWNLRRVRDPELRRRLTPDYQPMCKRIVMSWEYYEAMQRPNVKLVTEGIERVVPEGIVTRDGRTHPLDVLILATGFKTHEYIRPLELTNAQGLRLSSLWDERGPHAYYSLAIPGFPNFFLLGGPHSPLANGSVILYTEALVDYAMQCIELYRRGELDTLAPTQAATDAFYDELRRNMDSTVWVSGCQNWYIGKDGLPEVWPRRPREFNALLARPRLGDFEISRLSPACTEQSSTMSR
jgi:cation diffusion facilitator CzcD-associated flavoprotein CzcO